MIKSLTLVPPATAGPLVRTWASLYCQLSRKPLPAEIHGMDPSFGPYLEALYTAQGRTAPSYVLPQNFLFRTALRNNPSQCLVAFSGGKDCAATALELQRQGISPTLFYVKGLNSKSFPSEAVYAARVAGVLDLPFVQVQVQQEGFAEYPDNPVKNQFILALMVEWGIRHGFNQFAQGNLGRERLAETNLEFTNSDAAEMYETAAQVFDFATRGTFRYLGGVMDYESRSFATINETCPAVLGAMLSCITPYRHRPRLRDRNQAKFGVTLRAEVCGTCYKCASEYLHRVLMGLAPKVPAYVARCTEILRKAHQRLANLPELPSAGDALD